MNKVRSSVRGGFWLLLLVYGSLFAPIALAQGTKADYERAKTLPGRVADKVVREQIQPRWRGNGSFWYRVKTGPGGQFEWVDVQPASGARTVVLNSGELKKAIEKLADGKPSGNVIDQIEPDEKKAGVFQLRLGGDWWDWNKVAGELKKSETHRKEQNGLRSSQNVPRASLRQGPDTFITIVNKSGGLAHLQWIDPDGKPKGYGHLQPGEERRQHTFGGHERVFNDKGDDLAWIEADDEPTTVEIKQVQTTPAPAKSVAKKADEPRNKSRRGNAPEFEIRDHNIFLKENTNAAAVALTTDGTQGDSYRGPLLKSPDGKYLLARRVKPEQKHTVTIVESTPRGQLQPKLVDFQYLKPGDEIEQPRPVLINLESKKQVPIESDLIKNPWSLGDWHWAEDSSEFYFLFNQRGHRVVRLVGVNSKTGQARTVVEEKFDTFVDYTNKVWMHWLKGSKQLVWMSERDGFNHLYLVNVPQGKIEKPLTKGTWLVRKIEKVDESTGTIWFQAAGFYAGQDPYYLHFGRVGVDGSDFRILTDGDGSHAVTFSPDGQWLVDRYSRVDLPPVYELRSATDGSLKLKLETADATELEKSGWTKPERFAAKGRDGKTDIYGVIYRPSQFDPAKKYPVVEEVYAGPHGAHVPKSWGLQMRQHQLAELGFVVVQLDGMGTNWRGKSFHDVAAGNLADAGFPDRKAWIREAAKTRPWMDLNRVGIYGGSAGGQNAMRALIDHHDFYKVAVADCGCHDNRMDKIWWNEQWLGWPVGPQYELNSNSVHAHRMQGKLLLVVGELDQNVDPASTMQVVDALVKADKDFELLIIPGAGHGSAETPYGSRRRADFLVRHLYGHEPRQN